MPLLLYEWVDENKAKVSLIHFMPDDPNEGLADDVKAGGITVAELPEPPDPQDGKTAVLYCNPMTSEVWYELENRPLTADEQRGQETKQLRQRIEARETELAKVSPEFRSALEPPRKEQP
jgi:hypothetical protein